MDNVVHYAKFGRPPKFSFVNFMTLWNAKANTINLGHPLCFSIIRLALLSFLISRTREIRRFSLLIEKEQNGTYEQKKAEIICTCLRQPDITFDWFTSKSLLIIVMIVNQAPLFSWPIWWLSLSLSLFWSFSYTNFCAFRANCQ